MTRPDRVVAIAAMGLSALVSPMASAQSYPSRAVVMIVGQQPGGAADIVARLLAERLTQRLGKPVVVDNRSGAGGKIGAEWVARAAPDGHTLLLGSQTNVSIAGATSRDLRYDPAQDFVPIGRVVRIPYVLAANPRVPIHSIDELSAYARARPGELTFATLGEGTLGSIVLEAIKASRKVEILAVPYKGGASALADVLSGRVDMLFTDFATLEPYIRERKLRPLGSIGHVAPNATFAVPGITEQGVGELSLNTWYGLLAPRGTPANVVAALSEALRQIQGSEDVRRRFTELGFELIEDTPSQFAATIRSDIESVAKIVRGAQLQLSESR
jgi:tripartite-type tricarboxylate transporter receptor subunit TctC